MKRILAAIALSVCAVSTHAATLDVAASSESVGNGDTIFLTISGDAFPTDTFGGDIGAT